VTSEHCELCDELDNGSRGLALWPKLACRLTGDRVVAKSDEYICLVTAGPITRGHCLVLPRTHRSSMAAADPAEQMTLALFLRELRTLMKRVYGMPSLLFEHGAPEGSAGKRPCTVAHAHWHLVPVAIDPVDILVDHYTWCPTNNPFVAADREYLLVGNADGSYWVTYPEAEIPSQVLRQRLANRLGQIDRDWDWRREPAVGLMMTTLADFRASKRS